MKDFAGYEGLVAAMAEARRQARDNGPRGSNDELEAAMLLAQILAYSKWVSEQPPSPGETAVAEQPASTEQEDVGQGQQKAQETE